MTGPPAAALQGWPFLIGRGRVAGFQLLVGPDWLLAHRLGNLLLQTAGGDLSGSGEVVRCEVRSGTVDLTLFFRVVPAEVDGRRVVDEHSRSLRYTEGLVLSGRHPRVLVGPDVLSALHRAMTQAYAAFLDSPGESAGPVGAPAWPLRVAMLVRDAAAHEAGETHAAANWQGSGWRPSIVGAVRQWLNRLGRMAEPPATPAEAVPADTWMLLSMSTASAAGGPGCERCTGRDRTAESGSGAW